MVIVDKTRGFFAGELMRQLIRGCEILWLRFRNRNINQLKQIMEDLRYFCGKIVKGVTDKNVYMLQYHINVALGK